MKKRAIPQVPKPEQSRQSFDVAVKESLEVIMGRRDSRISTLPSTATNAEIIAKVNELILLLQE
ncbi:MULTISPECIES: hypothetical protein [Limnobacter]|jgi:hypothetical protein|uniref:hypothetical protein n=1 Tax=Limnobacter TaxID=131079 RepID=UPI0023B1B008|nr:hypothetical protein [Limnobacter sp. P1]